MHLLILPAVCLAVLRARKEPEATRHMAERFGGGATGPVGAVWIYAASLGEVRSAAPLVERMLAGGRAVCLTVQSPAGRAAGARLFGDAIREGRLTLRWVPLDLTWAMARFLRRLRPAMGVVMVNEIWPAQVLVARRLGVPMAMADGNVTERTVRRGGVRTELLRQFRTIATKGDRYRDRYAALGVDPGRMAVVGEVKFDLVSDPALVAAGRALRIRWAGEGPVLLVASSVEAEEAALVALILDLGHRAIWAPRSPQRFDAVAGALAAAGVTVARRSDLGDGLTGDPEGAQVILGDSVGEMAAWYAAADLVFVGATLADHGGHSVVEPLAAGLPVLIGPSVWGIEFPAREAAEAGALAILPDAAALAAEAGRLLRDPGALTAMSDRAAAFVDVHRGAAERTHAALLRVLDTG